MNKKLVGRVCSRAIVASLRKLNKTLAPAVTKFSHKIQNIYLTFLCFQQKTHNYDDLFCHLSDILKKKLNGNFPFTVLKSNIYIAIFFINKYLIHVRVC